MLNKNNALTDLNTFQLSLNNILVLFCCYNLSVVINCLLLKIIIFHLSNETNLINFPECL